MPAILPSLFGTAGFNFNDQKKEQGTVSSNRYR